MHITIMYVTIHDITPCALNLFRHSVCSNLVALLQYKTRLVDGDVATIELVVAGDDGGRC